MKLFSESEEKGDIPTINPPKELVSSNLEKNSSAACELFARIYKAQGDNAEALNWMDQALKHTKSGISWYWAMVTRKVEILLALKKRAEAKKFLQEYLDELYDWAMQNYRPLKHKKTAQIPLVARNGNDETLSAIYALDRIAKWGLECKEPAFAEMADIKLIKLDEATQTNSEELPIAIARLANTRKALLNNAAEKK